MDVRKLETLEKVLLNLRDWLRDDLVSEVMVWAWSRFPVAELGKLQLASAPCTPITIGARKGNARRVGEYAVEPKPSGHLPFITVDSRRSFFCGEPGQVYTGILFTRDAYRATRTREVIFLVPNDPPTSQEQEEDRIAETYMNRKFPAAMVERTGGFVRDVRQSGSSGLQSFDRKTGQMTLNADPIVHGRVAGPVPGNGLRERSTQSHDQLLQRVLQSNVYGWQQKSEDEIQGEVIGFTVMKGGYQPVTARRRRNVYGWTSNSMNKNAFSRPAGKYKQNLDADFQLRMERWLGEEIPCGPPPNRARECAQVSAAWAELIEEVLNSLTAIDFEEGGTEDPYFARRMGRSPGDYSMRPPIPPGYQKK